MVQDMPERAGADDVLHLDACSGASIPWDCHDQDRELKVCFTEY